MRLVWFFAFTSVAAYDDQSLMQQNLGVQHGVSSSEYKAALDHLGAAMQKMPYTGKMRQLAFDSLMQELSQQPALTAEAKKILQDVVDLFDSILAQFKSEKEINQATLDQLGPGVDYCNSMSMGTIGNEEETFRGAVDTANTCRNTTQANAFDQASSACYAVLRTIHQQRGNRLVVVSDETGSHTIPISCDRWSGHVVGNDQINHAPRQYCVSSLTGPSDPICRETTVGSWADYYWEIHQEEHNQGEAFGKHSAFIEEIASLFHAYPHSADNLMESDTTHTFGWKRSFDAYDTWVTKGINEMGSNPTKITTCRTKTTDLEVAIASCDGKQTEAGSKYCLWRKSKLELCGTGQNSRHQCYYNHTEAHVGPGGVQDTIRPIADKRTAEGKLVEFIRCLVVNLRNEETRPELCDSAVNETKAQEDFNVTYPVNASMTPCPTLDVDMVPSDDDQKFKDDNLFGTALAKAPWYSYEDAQQDCSSIGQPDTR